MKITRTALERPTALPGPYHGFFSFPVSKGGYSGVAVYADSRIAIPIKAEEGLTGMLQPKPPLSPEERVSSASSYPDPDDFEFFPEEDGTTPPDFASAGIDYEGRALVVDFGLFVLVNVYCPAETSDSRLSFKMNFHRLLEKRVRSLIADGREVILVGDINIAATPLDHGEGSLASRQIGFYDHPPRAWYKSFLEPDGPMVDAVRKCHPEREGMFTRESLVYLLHLPPLPIPFKQIGVPFYQLEDQTMDHASIISLLRKASSLGSNLATYRRMSLGRTTVLFTSTCTTKSSFRPEKPEH